MMQITDTQKIGAGLVGFGVTFMFLGVLFLFDKGLLAIGNVLFLSGLACFIGFKRTWGIFFTWRKAKGSTIFFSGILIVLLGWPLTGMCVELYGIIVLFRDYFSVLGYFLRMTPIGSCLDRLFSDDNHKNMI